MIQAQTKTVDSWGDANAVAWSTVATVRAGVEPVSGNEQLRSNQRSGETFYRVVMRYKAYPTLSARNRLQFTLDGVTKTLNIESVLPTNTNRRDFEIMCSEGINLG